MEIQQHHLRAVLGLILVTSLACASTTGSGRAEAPGEVTAEDPLLADAVALPISFRANRFFATPVTVQGDTVTIFLDTGDDGRLFTAAVTRLGLASDSVPLRRGYHRVASLPAFRADRTLPGAVAASPVGARILVTDPKDQFDTLMSAHAIGQLGQLWFADRVWTFDYPHQRLLLRAALPRLTDSRAHVVPLDFMSDTAGRALNHIPRVPVVIDGDTLRMLFDIGATVWLTDSALAELHDGQPAERAWSLVRQTIFTRWRARHPDWRVIAHADRATGADLIEVPRMTIGGFDVGPLWFGEFADKGWPAAPPLRVRVDGTVGGSGLSSFEVSLDYQGRLAQFIRE